MPLAFTIDGLRGERAQPSSSQVMSQALGMVRFAALDGFRQIVDAELPQLIDKKLFWVKVGTGVAAGAAVLALIVTAAKSCR